MGDAPLLDARTRDETLAELLETTFLNCDVCGEKFKQARILPCLHSFCESCVNKLAKGETSTADNNKVQFSSCLYQVVAER